MKKILIAVFATLLVAAYVAPAMALETTFDGQYRVRAIYTDNVVDTSDDDTDGSSWLDQRFRLGITMKEAPVTGYVQLQLGGGGTNSSKVWGVDAGTDAIQVRQAYLDFPVGPVGPVGAVGVRLGRTYASHGFLGGGMFENIADRFVFSYKVSDELNLSFIHAKGRELKTGGPAAGANDADRNIYNLGGAYKLGALGDAAARVYYVKDGAFYISPAGVSTAGGSWSATWLTAQANLKFNPVPKFEPVNVYVSGAYLTGESNGPATYDIAGYAVHGDVNTSFGPAKVGAVVGMGSGDDDTSDDELNTFFAPGGASYIQSVLFFQSGENNYSIGSIGGVLNTQNGSRETLSNVTWAGLYGEYMALDDLTVGGRLATFSQTEEGTAANASTDADDIGTELDLTANYKLHKNLTLLAAVAWFMPGDAYTGKDLTATAKDDTITAYYSRVQWTF